MLPQPSVFLNSSCLTQPVQRHFLWQGTSGVKHSVLPAHWLLTALSADHRAESRPAVPGIADEGKDEPNGEDTQGGHGAVTGDSIFVFLC